VTGGESDRAIKPVDADRLRDLGLGAYADARLDGLAQRLRTALRVPAAFVSLMAVDHQVLPGQCGLQALLRTHEELAEVNAAPTRAPPSRSFGWPCPGAEVERARASELHELLSAPWPRSCSACCASIPTAHRGGR